MKALKSFFLLFILVFLLFSCGADEQPVSVVLMIGDGMGYEQVKAASLYYYGETGRLSFESLPVKGSVTTRSADNPVILNNGAGILPAVNWGTTGHTAADVAVYSNNIISEQNFNQIDNNDFFVDVQDNTDIYITLSIASNCLIYISILNIVST